MRGSGPRAPSSRTPTARRNGAEDLSRSLSWLFLLTSGLGRALGRLPGYRLVRPLDAEARSAVDWVTGAALAIRREAWEAVGPLDGRYRFYAQDLDFCLSLRDAGWHVALAKGFRVMHLGGRHHRAAHGRRAKRQSRSAVGRPPDLGREAPRPRVGADRASHDASRKPGAESRAHAAANRGAARAPARVGCGNGGLSLRRPAAPDPERRADVIRLVCDRRARVLRV